MITLDDRLNPARGPFSGSGTDFQVTAGVACLRAAPIGDAMLETQALHGETITIFGERDGFGWGQMQSDGYVGWVEMDGLSAPVLPVTHRVHALRTYVFSEPDLKSAPRFLLSLNSHVVAEETNGKFVRCTRAGWVFDGHLSALGQFASDPVDVALGFLGAPYQWGGKESLGLDCSGLIQMAYAGAGKWMPRDSDMQAKALGGALDLGGGVPKLRRGDLVFWKGHVGIMVDEARLLHANAFHMATAIEPVSGAIDRIREKYGDVTKVIRPAA
jgi:cell wall-associated NlpC family hydrolase